MAGLQNNDISMDSTQSMNSIDILWISMDSVESMTSVDPKDSIDLMDSVDVLDFTDSMDVNLEDEYWVPNHSNSRGRLFPFEKCPS